MHTSGNYITLKKVLSSTINNVGAYCRAQIEVYIRAIGHRETRATEQENRNQFFYARFARVSRMSTKFVFKRSRLRSDQHRKPGQIQHEHRREQPAGAARRTFELLPDEYAPNRADQGRTLTEPVR